MNSIRVQPVGEATGLKFEEVPMETLYNTMRTNRKEWSGIFNITVKITIASYCLSSLMFYTSNINNNKNARLQVPL